MMAMSRFCENREKIDRPLFQSRRDADAVRFNFELQKKVQFSSHEDTEDSSSLVAKSPLDF